MSAPRIRSLRPGLLLLVLPLFAWTGACVSPAPGPSTPVVATPVTVTTHRYGPRPEQVLDLYRPETGGGPAPTPVVVWAHGGAWITGSRSDIPAVIRALPQAGIAVASIDYRLGDPEVPDSAFPGPVIDVKTAAAWLGAHAADLGIDPLHVVAAGGSAGGLLAVVAATTFGEPDLTPVIGGEVHLAGAVSIAGPAEPWMFLDGAFDRAVRVFLGCPQSGSCPNAMLAGTAQFFDASDPPLLGIYGEADLYVEAWMGQAQHYAALTAGMDSTYVVVPGANHGTIEDLADFGQLVGWLRARFGSAQG